MSRFSKWRESARGSVYDPRSGVDWAALALSSDPDKYRRVAGEAAKRIVGAAIYCSGCDRPIGVTLCRDNDERLIAARHGDVTVYVRTDGAGPPIERVNAAGDSTSWVFHCPRGCRGKRGGPRELQLTAAKAQQIVDEVARTAGPNVRRVVPLRML